MNPEQLVLSVLGFTVASLSAVLAYVWKSTRDDTKERMDTLETIADDLRERIVVEEKATIRQNGEIARLDDSHDRLVRTLEGLALKLDRIIERLPAPPRYQPHSSADTYRAVPRPTKREDSDPPKGR